MKTFKTLAILFSLGLILTACSDDDDTATIPLDAGTLAGGPFTFTIDDTPDMVSEISLSNFNSTGDVQTYVITDASKTILGLPANLTALEAVDFNTTGVGECLIYHLTYNTGLTGLEIDENVSTLVGEFDLSNAIMVTRIANQTASFTVTIENVFQGKEYFNSGVTGLIKPGESAEITFNAGMGDYLSFATMFVQSNDLFFAPADNGLRLYDADGNAITGDITGTIDLWDAGTEVNEAPGTGANQPPRQTDLNTGTDENSTVKLIANVNDGYTYPMVNETIKVMLAHDGGTLFTVSLMNVSNTSSIPTPLAPGTWVIHKGNQKPLFVTGEAASDGLEKIAEDGKNEVSNAELSAMSGLVSPFAPGAYAINDAIFTSNTTASDALEKLAEDGMPGGFANFFNTPIGAAEPGPIFPGDSYSFEFTAEAGDILSFATMLIQSNDWIIGANDIELFTNGTALSGDITTLVKIYDSGTEVDEYAGAGANQPPRHTGPNTGTDENGMVGLETELTGNVPEITNMLKITITSN